MRALTVRAERDEPHRLSLHYRLEGDLARLRLPPRSPSAPADGLWRTTCFEAFVKRGAAPAYLELNVSPSTEWAVYTFDGYRRGMHAPAARRAPAIGERRSAEVFELDVTLDFEGLFTESAALDRLLLGAAAVLEDGHGRLHYWALAHPSERPDFHHPESFALELAAPGATT